MSAILVVAAQPDEQVTIERLLKGLVDEVMCIDRVELVQGAALACLPRHPEGIGLFICLDMGDEAIAFMRGAKMVCLPAVLISDRSLPDITDLLVKTRVLQDEHYLADYVRQRLKLPPKA